MSRSLGRGGLAGAGVLGRPEKARDIIKSADEHSDKSVDEALKFRDQKRGHDIR